MRKARSSGSAVGSMDLPGTGVSVVPTTTRPCHGTAKSTRPSSVFGIMMAESPGRNSFGSTMCTPWLAATISATPGSSCFRSSSTKTPVAFTTARAGISNSAPVSTSFASTPVILPFSFFRPTQST